LISETPASPGGEPDIWKRGQHGGRGGLPLSSRKSCGRQGLMAPEAPPALVPGGGPNAHTILETEVHLMVERAGRTSPGFCPSQAVPLTPSATARPRAASRRAAAGRGRALARGAAALGGAVLVLAVAAGAAAPPPGSSASAARSATAPGAARAAGATSGSGVSGAATAAAGASPARLSRAEVPAAGHQEAILTVDRCGRYSVRAASRQGTAVHVIDRMAGELGAAGEAGHENGRIDLLLDRGEYKVVAESDEHGEGAAALSVAAFRETRAGATPAAAAATVQPAGDAVPQLVERRLLRESLDDLQQISYWMRLAERREIRLEAAGRNLADLRLWRDGSWLEAVEPSCTTIQPVTGQPLLRCEVAAILPAGLYLLTAYGGPSQPWAEDAAEHPLHLRWGHPLLPDAGRRRYVVSPFGEDWFALPANVNYARIELPQAAPARLLAGWVDPGRLLSLLTGDLSPGAREEAAANPAPAAETATGEVAKNSVPPVAEVRMPDKPAASTPESSANRRRPSRTGAGRRGEPSIGGEEPAAGGGSAARDRGDAAGEAGNAGNAGEAVGEAGAGGDNSASAVEPGGEDAAGAGEAAAGAAGGGGEGAGAGQADAAAGAEASGADTSGAAMAGAEGAEGGSGAGENGAAGGDAQAAAGGSSEGAAPAPVQEGADNAGAEAAGDTAQGDSSQSGAGAAGGEGDEGGAAAAGGEEPAGNEESAKAAAAAAAAAVPVGPQLWVAVRGTPGQSYVLQHFEQRKEYSFRNSGPFWLSTIHSGDPGDSVDATAALTSRSAGGDEHQRLDASSAVVLDGSHAWVRRFNLLAPLDMFVEVRERGRYQVACSGGGRFRMEPFLTSRPENYKPPAFVRKGAHWDLDPGLYVLTAQPEAHGGGIVTLGLRPAGKFDKLLDGAPDAVRASARFAPVNLDGDRRYTLYLNHQPGVESGAVFRGWPVDLDQALPVTQRPGEPLTIELVSGEGGRLRAETEDGRQLAASVDGGPWQEGPAVPGGGHHRVELRNPADAGARTISYSLWIEPPGIADAAPLPPLPAAALAALPRFPALRPGAPRFVDLARGASLTFLVQADRPALYQLQTTGVLATSASLRTRTVTSLAAASANGIGRNAMVRQYLRAGDFQATVSGVGRSQGHLAVELAATPLLDGGELRLDAAARLTLPAGQGVVYRFSIAQGGDYRLLAMGLGFVYTCRLEDADGWPVAPPNVAADLSRHFAPGSYRLVLLPQPVAARAVTLLSRPPAALRYTGHGPHALPLARTVEHLWREPDAAAANAAAANAATTTGARAATSASTGAATSASAAATTGASAANDASAAHGAGTGEPGQERPPDLWRFELPAAARATISLDAEMTGTLTRLDGGAPAATGQAAAVPDHATATANQAAGAAGTAASNAAAAPAVELGSVPPGRSLAIDLGAGRYQLAVVCSRRNSLVRYHVRVATAELLDGQERLVTAPATLTVSAAGTGLVEISSYSAGDVRARLFAPDGRLVADEDDRPDDWNFLISERLDAGRYRLEIEPVGRPSAKLRVSMRTVTEVEDRPLALPHSARIDLGGDVHLLPIVLPARADLLLLAARSDESLGLGLEVREAAGWRLLSVATGRWPRLALPLAPAAPPASTSSGSPTSSGLSTSSTSTAPKAPAAQRGLPAQGEPLYRVRVWSLERRGTPAMLGVAAITAPRIGERRLAKGAALPAVSGLKPPLAPLAAAVLDLDGPGVLSLQTESSGTATGRRSGRGSRDAEGSGGGVEAPASQAGGAGAGSTAAAGGAAGSAGASNGGAGSSGSAVGGARGGSSEGAGVAGQAARSTGGAAGAAGRIGEGAEDGSAGGASPWQAGSVPGQALAPLDEAGGGGAAVAYAAAGDRIWIVAAGPRREARVRGSRLRLAPGLDAPVSFRLPNAAAVASCDLDRHALAGPMLALVTAPSGQPAVVIDEAAAPAARRSAAAAMGIGPRSAVTVALAPRQPVARVWDGEAAVSGAAAPDLRLAQLSFPPPQGERAGWGVTAGLLSGIGARQFELPPGAKTIRLSLGPSMVAVLSEGDTVASTHWQGGQPFEEQLDGAATRLTLLHTRPGDDPWTFEVLARAAGESELALPADAPFARSFDRAGTLRLRLAPAAGPGEHAYRIWSGATAGSQGASSVDAVLLDGAGGAHRAAADSGEAANAGGIEVDGAAGGYLLIRHGPGVVVAWEEGVLGPEGYAELWSPTYPGAAEALRPPPAPGTSPPPAAPWAPADAGGGARSAAGQPVTPPATVALAGRFTRLAVAAREPVVLHVRAATPALTLLKPAIAASAGAAGSATAQPSTALSPGISGASGSSGTPGTAAPAGSAARAPEVEIHAAAVRLDALLPAGTSWLGFSALGDAELSGFAELTTTPVVPATEGLGPEILLPAGDTRYFSFHLDGPRAVGWGASASAESVACRLLHADGSAVVPGRIGAGKAAALADILEMSELSAGDYLLALTSPPDAAPLRVRPVLVGLTLPDTGPPPEVIRKYMQEAGAVSAAAVPGSHP
jgi:hypothetical protein